MSNGLTCPSCKVDTVYVSFLPVVVQPGSAHLGAGVTERQICDECGWSGRTREHGPGVVPAAASTRDAPTCQLGRAIELAAGGAVFVEWDIACQEFVDFQVYQRNEVLNAEGLAIQRFCMRASQLKRTVQDAKRERIEGGISMLRSALRFARKRPGGGSLTFKVDGGINLVSLGGRVIGTAAIREGIASELRTLCGKGDGVGLFRVDRE